MGRIIGTSEVNWLESAIKCYSEKKHALHL